MKSIPKKEVQIIHHHGLKKHHKWSIAAYDCGVDNLWTSFLTSITRMLSAIKSRWTPRQREVISYVRTKMKSSEIAQKLEISRQAIEKMVMEASFKEVREVEINLTSAIFESIKNERKSNLIELHN